MIAKIKKEELLTTLKANRATHRKIFEEALEGYRKEVISQLEQRLTDAKKNKRVDLVVRLVQPVDQTGEYDRAIRLLEMTINKEVELSENEFDQLVMDN